MFYFYHKKKLWSTTNKPFVIGNPPDI